MAVRPRRGSEGLQAQGHWGLLRTTVRAVDTSIRRALQLLVLNAADHVEDLQAKQASDNAQVTWDTKRNVGDIMSQATKKDGKALGIKNRIQNM